MVNLHTCIYIRLYRAAQSSIARNRDAGSRQVAEAEMEPGLRVTGHRVSDFGRVGSRVSVSDPVFDPVLSFNMRVTVYRGVVSTK